MTTLLDQLRGLLEGSVSPPPIATLIGFRLVAVEPGQVVIELETTARHANWTGTLHGGVVGDIADAAMGLAFGSTLGDGETFATVEMKVSFLRPVRRTTLRATGKLVRGGRTLGFSECDVTDASGQVVARASATLMRVRDGGVAVAPTGG